MTEYALYLESGPRRRKTMVHVLDLLGCIARGPTTQSALEATPKAIRAYLRFLRRHGDHVEPDGSFTTVVAEHVTEGPWLGNGNPAGGFGPDFQTLSAEELAIFLGRLDWLREDLLGLIGNLTREQMEAEPGGRERSIHRILEHIAECQYVYLRAMLGRVNGLPSSLRSLREHLDMLPTILVQTWEITRSRLEVMNGAERAKSVKRGQVTWTARRGLRRMLEHEWEHLLEVSERLERPMV